MPTKTLLDAFSQLKDPRSPRGIRHPFAGIVVLMLLGMLARIREMEVLVRWATMHWDQLRGPLGFERDKPPSATTISRTLSQCQVGDFQTALAVWLRACLSDSDTEGILAVDGKTAKQGLDENGRPLPMLNAFVHDLQAVVGQWSTGAEKTNEPTLLRRHLEEMLDLPGCQIGLRVDRELCADDGKIVRHDTRYYVCSLDPEQVTAADLLRHVRQHWRIENSLHFIKDRWWDEDRHPTRRPGLSACLAAINNAALSIHRLKSDPEIPLRAAADYIAWSPAVGLQLLNS